MTVIVHEIEPGVFLEWPSGRPLMLTCRTEMVQVRRAGILVGEEERPCDPYEIEEAAPPHLSVWKNHSDEELADRKLYRATPFDVPEGKRTVGDARYERDKDGVVRQMFDVEDIPPAPPVPELTPAEKLRAANLSEAEFDSLVAASLARQLDN